MKHLVLVLVFASLAILSSASKYSDCGSTTGDVSAVEVANCTDEQDECILTRGSFAIITIHFASKADSKSLEAVVYGIIASVPIPFPLPQADACKDGVTCPVKNGQNYTYSNKLNIKKRYPPISLGVRYELKDENKYKMVCVEIPCKIV